MTIDKVFDEVLAVMSGDAAQIAEDKANAYVNAGVLKDKLTRYSGSPSQDRDIFGRPLRAGS